MVNRSRIPLGTLPTQHLHDVTVQLARPMDARPEII